MQSVVIKFLEIALCAIELKFRRSLMIFLDFLHIGRVGLYMVSGNRNVCIMQYLLAVAGFGAHRCARLAILRRPRCISSGQGRMAYPDSASHEPRHISKIHTTAIRYRST